MTNNDQQRFEGTIRAVIGQDNENVRTAMIEAYASLHPERRDEMLERLRQLNVPIVAN